MQEWLIAFRNRKNKLEDKCNFSYQKRLQDEITSAISKRDRRRLDLLTVVYNKYSAIRFRLNAIREPATYDECNTALNRLNEIEVDFHKWLSFYYKKLDSASTISLF